MGGGLVGHVDHVRAASGIEMGQHRSKGTLRAGVIIASKGHGARKDFKRMQPLTMKRGTPHACRPLGRRRALRSRVLAGILALASAWTPVAQSQVRLPSMGETVSSSMPLGSERRLGDEIWTEVRRDASYLDDPVLTEYLQSLWLPLVQAAVKRGEISEDMRTQFAWDAFLIRDRSINAFALPGGYVGVHLGLIAATATRDELVSVLAHELSHVTQRHIARSIESAGRQSAMGVAAILLGIIAASRSGNPDFARAAVAGGQAALLQGQLNFSRDMEREADRIGQTLMSDAGYEAAGMPAMFDKLDKAYRLNDSGAFPYLRSHPLTVERIAEAQSRAGIASRAGQQTDDEHDLMRARARVLMDSSVPALRSHVQALRQQPVVQTVAPGLAYGAALAAIGLKDEAAARDALGRLPRAAAGAPSDSASRSARWLGLLRAEAALELGAAALGGATAARAPAPPATQWARPELIIWGKTVLKQADTARAEDPAFKDLHQALRAWLVKQRKDATLWEMLAACETISGNRLAMMRATAEAHLASGNAEAALVTLRSARQVARTQREVDGVELAVIDARLSELTRQKAQREGRDGKDSRDGREPREGRDARGLRPVAR
jgi:predicted Zn-dependent protease